MTSWSGAHMREHNDPEKSRKNRLTLRKLILAVALIALLLGVVWPAYRAFDAFHHGPFTRAYNRECQRLADDAHLIGKPESEVLVVLGPPTSIWDYDQPGGRTRTFNYQPSF